MISMLDTPPLPNTVRKAVAWMDAGTTTTSSSGDDTDDDDNDRPKQIKNEPLLGVEWSNAQLKKWGLKRFGRYRTLLTAKHDGKLPQDQEIRLKRIERLIKNREFAAQSRKRKREYVKELEQEVVHLKSEIKRMKETHLCQKCEINPMYHILVCNEKVFF